MPRNTNSPTTSIDEARSALGSRLRELRKRAGVSGRQLADTLGWTASKISKIENARQSPTDADIRGWAEAVGASDETETLLGELHAVESRHAEWSRLLRDGGLAGIQHSISHRDEQVRLFRCFQGVVVPGVLQTADYAHAVFTRVAAKHGRPGDVEDAVQGRLRRQDVLYRRDKRFHLVLTESVLRYRLAPVDTMLGQFDRLLTVGGLRNVRLGVIPFDADYGLADPSHSFWILDEDLVNVETYSAELNLRQPQEIAVYAGVFARLARLAVYGADARAVITRVAGELAREAEEAGE